VQNDEMGKNSVKWTRFAKTLHQDFEQAWFLTTLAYCDNIKGF